MIGLDTNLLVYAHRSESVHHRAAIDAISRALRSGPVGIPWPCFHEFISTVTHPKLWREPLSIADALACVERLASTPRMRVLGEGLDHLAKLRTLAVPAQLRGGQIHDARIAAICLSHGVSELWSCDRDFGRFPTLRVRNPLVG